MFSPPSASPGRKSPVLLGLKLSPVRELSFPRFLTIIKPMSKLVFNGPILIKVSDWDLKGHLID